MKGKLLALIVGIAALLAVGAGRAAADNGGTQAAGQSATSAQSAQAASGAAQSQPSNSNVSVRVLSPGSNGSTTQTNSVGSTATAGNSNATGQSAGQTQAGGGGTQAAGQSAGNEQAAQALSLASQSGASNQNTPVRVLSPGSNGSTTQTNDVSSGATAGNTNGTSQGATQNQAGGSCYCQDSGSQSVGQDASNEQSAGAASAAKQESPSNKNVDVRVLSPGDNGSVTQSNDASSSASAGNRNTTDQSSAQTQAGGRCGCDYGGGIQAAGQQASNAQEAGALSLAAQEGAKNSNTPVRVLSPGSDGSVTQTNSVDSSASSGNSNTTSQKASQTQGGSGSSGIQALGQAASNEQASLAASAAIQKGAKNQNTPVRVLSPGSGGSVTQSNTVSSGASAGNSSSTGQSASQTQAGDHCGCRYGYGAIQASGQQADNAQESAALSFAVQLEAANWNAPVRVESPDRAVLHEVGRCMCLAAPSDSSAVKQSNTVGSGSSAGNRNETGQNTGQAQGTIQRKLMRIPY